MRFLDICRNPHNAPDGDTPYLFVIQRNSINLRSTRVVVEAVSPLINGGLMPEFTVEDRRVVDIVTGWF